jgi:UrcA family protein
MPSFPNATLAGLGAALLLTGFAHAAPVPTPAQAGSETVSVSVRFADLDVNRPEGVATLRRRVEAAVTTVCGGEPDQRFLDQVAAYEHCRKAALDEAMSRIAAITHADGRTALAQR